jgi:hypothetical protein
MPVSRSALKKLPATLSALPAIFALSISLFLTACGGSAGSSSGMGSTPTPTPSTAKEWTWMSGSSTVGAASTGNGPGGRINAVSWVDSNGNFWLFGGYGFDSTGMGGDLNDLWEYQL